MDLHTPVRVELHTWIDGNPQHAESVIDVTRFVSNLTWTDSLRAPWTDIQLQLTIPYRMIRDIIPGRKVKHGLNLSSNTNQLPPSSGKTEVESRYGYVPEPGFWVVVRNLTPFGIVGTGFTNEASSGEASRTLAFGRCHTVSFGVAAQQGSGLTMTMPVNIQAESFLAFTGRSNMKFAPQGKGSWGMEGFVWDIGNWSDNLMSMTKSLITGRPGDLMAKLWGSIVKLELPPSLSSSGGGTFLNTMGDLVPVVHDQATALKWAPMRTFEVPHVIGGMAVPSVGGLLPNNPSLLQFFLTTFYANHEAVEMFSTIDYPAEGMTQTLTPLGKALGVQPIIIYRLKPWFIEGVSKATVQKYSEAKDPAAAAAQLSMDKAGVGAFTSRKAGAGGVQWFEWAKDEVVRVQMAWSDGMRANLVFGDWFFANTDDPANYGLTGTPIVPDTEDVKRHGLRAYGMRWPFFQKGDVVGMLGSGAVGDAVNAGLSAAGTAMVSVGGVTGSPVLGTLAAVIAGGAATVSALNTSPIDYNNAICELAWMMAGDGQRWCMGSFNGLYKPQVKPGHWATLNLFDSTLTCYIEAVSHSVTVDQTSGHIRKETTVSFSRGTLRHQDTPSYQYRLETRGSNPPGAPVELVTKMDEPQGVESSGKVNTSADPTVFQKLQALVSSKAKAIPGGQPVLYTADIPLLKPAVNKVSSLKHCIVVHYTAGSSLSGMLYEFNKQRVIGENGGTYNTSTHYSVESSGRIIQWLDPMKYSANHVAGAQFPEKSIGIDVIGTGSSVVDLHLKNPTQWNALVQLIAYLRSKFNTIPNVVSTPNTYYTDGTTKYYKMPIPSGITKLSGPRRDGDRYTMTDVTKNGWGIVRHRDFNNTACPGQLPLELVPAAVTALGAGGTSLQVTKLDPKTQTELVALATKYGLL